MKTFAILLIIFGSIFALSRLAMRQYVYYDFNNNICSSWDLSVRASTISQKSEYMNKFVSDLDNCKLDGVNDAIFFQTPESDFSQNLKAVKSLQKRLMDISGMDENSFAYQTALQQITGQEQGEAKEMIGHFFGCWEKIHYYTFWNDIITWLFIIIQIGTVIAGVIILAND